jgi:hypothetical protein
MVVEDTNQGSGGGGREGALAFIAIAVVLFFVIRVYMDYVTATGQAVKPPRKPKIPNSATVQDSALLEESIGPRNSFGELVGGDRNRRITRRPVEEEIVPEEEQPARSRRVVPDEEPPVRSEPARPRDERPFDSAVAYRKRDPYAGQIVINRAGNERRRDPHTSQIIVERSPEVTTDRATVSVSTHNHRTAASQTPRTIDDRDALENSSVRQAVATSGRAPYLFRSSNPYPGEYDDIQVGDRLSEITAMDLPRAKLTRSVFTFRPKTGPFKAVQAMLTTGPLDPVVTGVAYVFRNAGSNADVTRQALETFGEGEITLTNHGELRVWPHLKGYMVSLDRDKYTVEQDMTSEGMRAHRRSASSTTR